MKTLLLSIIATLTAISADFPPLGAVTDPESRGLGIQRTMALLATSTLEKRNPSASSSTASPLPSKTGLRSSQKT